MRQNKLIVKGACEHNLKNVDVEIPRDKLVVFTGLSGSGKSSLAFDTIYAEGQRRYVESLSSYARQFLGQMEKPKVDYIEGLSPAISIDQKTTSKNPRSTVGTVTEIYDYLRLLYARVGIPHCPVCGREISRQSVDTIVDRIMELESGTKIQILSPIVSGRKGEYVKELDGVRKSGFVRVRIDGITYDLSEQIKLEKNKKHNIEVIVDRLVIKDEIRSRLSDSVETAAGLSKGLIIIDVIGGEEIMFSQNYACPEHGVSVEELNPRMFSFNNPFGACQKCSGLGIFMKVSEKLVVPDPRLSIRQGAIKASGWSAADGGTIAMMYFEALAKEYNFSLDVPYKDLPEKAKKVIMYGTDGKKIKMQRRSVYGEGTYMKDFEGIINNIERRYAETTSEYSRNEIEQLMTAVECPECGGARLKKESLFVTVGGINIYEFCSKSIKEALKYTASIQSNSDSIISIAEQLTADKTTDYEKVLALHDWICSYMYYDVDSLASDEAPPYYATDIVKSRKAVCLGFATLMASLCRSIDIPCNVVSGYALGVGNDTAWTDISIATDEQNHAWNEVYVDGRWMIVDTTWDCANKIENGEMNKGEVSHLYFDANLQFFSNNHKILEYSKRR